MSRSEHPPTLIYTDYSLRLTHLTIHVNCEAWKGFFLFFFFLINTENNSIRSNSVHRCSSFFKLAALHVRNATMIPYPFPIPTESPFGLANLPVGIFSTKEKVHIERAFRSIPYAMCGIG